MNTRNLAKTRLTSPTRAALTLLAAISALNFASAAVLTWDGSNTSNSQADGGTGNWDTSTANWWDGAGNVAWPTTGTTNEAIFANTGDLVFPDAGGVSVNKLTFNSSGYYIVGTSTLTLNGTSPSISVASGVSSFIGANSAVVVAGTAGLTKTDAGTLTINGTVPATLTGGITVQRGTLALSLANLSTPTNILPASNSLALQGGTLSVTGSTVATSTQTFSGTSLSGGTSTLFLNKNGGTGTLNVGSITRATGSVVNFTGNTTLNGTASTSEMIKVTANATVANGGHAAWAVANNPTTSTGRWVSVDASGTIKLVTAVGDVVDNYAAVTNPALVYNRFSSATLTANATAQAIQNNNINNNTLTTAIGANTLTVNGLSCIQLGATNLWSFTSTGSGGIKVGAEKELILIGAGNFAFSAPIADNPGGASGLTHAGGGTVTLNGNNTYTGQTTVNSGILQLGTNGSINSSSGVKVNGGSFLYNLATPLVPTVTAAGGSVTGNGTFNAITVPHLATGTIGNNGSSSLTVGNLTFGGSGTLNLNTTAALALNVTGTLVTTPANGRVALTLSGITDWGTVRSYDLIQYGSWSGSLSDFNIATLPALGGRKSATISSTGPTNGTIRITVTGDSALWTGVASGNWTQTAVGTPYNWQSLANSTPTEFAANDDVIFDDTGVTTSVVISDATVTATSTIFNNSTKNYTVSSPGNFAIAGGSLTKNGNGTVTLNTANTYTNGTTVNGGRLITTNSMPSGTAATPTSISVASGAILEYNYNVADVIQSANTLSGAGTILKTGSKTLTLGTATSTVALSGGGLIDVQAGTLKAADDISQSTVFTNNLGDLNIAAGATFECYSTRVRVDKLTGAGTLQAGYFGPRAITIGVNGGNSTFSGNITNNAVGNSLGTAALVKAGNGSITLTGTINLRNNTSDSNAGNDVLRVTDGSTLSPSTLTLSPSGNSTIGDIGQNNAVDVAIGQNDVGVLNHNAGTINTTSLNIGNQGVGTYNMTGGITNTKSVLLAFTGASTGPNGEATLNVGGNATLSLQSNGKLTLGTYFGRKATVNQTGGTVSLYSDAGTTLGGNGSLAFDGGSDLSAYNLLGGTLAIPAITLRASGGGAGGGSGTVNFGGGVLKITNAAFTIPTTGNKTVALNVLGNGTVANSGANIDTNGLAITLNAPLVHGGNETIDGGLTKLGAGTLTLTSNNTYTGPTTVQVGTLALTGNASLGSSAIALVTGTTLNVSALTAADFTANALSGNGTLSGTGKALTISGAYAPGSLAITGNVTFGGNATSTFLASSTPGASSATAVTGSVLNAGTLVINPAPSFTFSANQSFTFVTASSGITPGYAGVTVNNVALTNASGVWSAISGNLSYTYTESNATLTLAPGIVITPLQAWRNTYFPTTGNDGTGIGANNADPDGDGFSNLIEYATNTNPNVAGSAVVNSGTSGGHLTLTFPRIDDPALTYTVQGRDDLVTGAWSAVVPVAGNNPTAGFTGSTPGVTETVSETVVDTVTIGSQSKRFLRLQVGITP